MIYITPTIGQPGYTPEITLCHFCHKPITQGISDDFKVTTYKPKICLDCAMEIQCTMHLENGGFW